MLAKEPRIGRHLCRIAPRIIAQHNHRAALGMRTHQIAQCQRVRSHMRAHTFLNRDRPQTVHLRAIDHRRAKRLVVGNGSVDATLLQ